MSDKLQRLAQGIASTCNRHETHDILNALLAVFLRVLADMLRKAWYRNAVLLQVIKAAAKLIVEEEEDDVGQAQGDA